MRKWTIDALLDRAHPEPNSGCWMWMGAVQKGDYGSVRDKGRVRGAHQVAFELRHGPIKAGHLVMHKCDNSLCINPEHLTSGTHRDNSNDKIAKGRDRNRGEKHYRSLLTDAVVRELRKEQRPFSRRRAKELADRYEVRPRTIEHAVYGITWKHIGDEEP